MKQNYSKCLIADDTWQILEFDYDAIYYLEGSERGLLIDTGIGGDDLKGFVDAIATNPYDVVLTHGHLDHTGAIRQFPKVYVNEKDWDMARVNNEAQRRAFIEHLYEMSIGAVPDQDASSMLHFGDEMPEFCNVKEGDTFDLGGRTVTVSEFPGHTKGCICLYDDQSNLLFVGDAIIHRLLLLEGPSDYTERLKAWKRYADRVVMSRLDSLSGVYLGHTGRAPRALLTTVYSIACRLIDDISLINTCDGVSYQENGYQIRFEFRTMVDDAE